MKLLKNIIFMTKIVYTHVDVESLECICICTYNTCWPGLV